jgi:hypothetical protein
MGLFDWLFPPKKSRSKPAPLLRDMTFAEIVRVAKKAPKPRRGPKPSAQTLAQKHLQWCREMNPTLTSNVVRTTQNVGMANYKPLSAAQLAQRDARILARRRRRRR